jgi:hypothetical protein
VSGESEDTVEVGIQLALQEHEREGDEGVLTVLREAPFIQSNQASSRNLPLGDKRRLVTSFFQKGCLFGQSIAHFHVVSAISLKWFCLSL